MKLRNLFLASVACAGLFAACSNAMDEVIENKQEQEQVDVDAYASFTFVMPAGSGARALATEDGSSEENNFTSVKILLFKADGTAGDAFTLGRSAFTPTTTGGATYYTTKDDLGISSPGAYSVHVLVNPTTSFDKLATLAEYEAELEVVATKTGDYCVDNKFLMTNADNKVNVEIKKEHNKGNAAKMTVRVERMAAKVTFTAKANNEYTVENSNGIKVTFDAFKVINTRSNAFGLRRAGISAAAAVIGEKEIVATNYVIDNIFAQKTSTHNQTLFNANYSRRHDTYVAFRKLNANAADQPLAYCLENTMEQTSQINGWSTGIIFRGKLNVPTAQVGGTVDAKGNLYRYDGQFYATLQDLVKGTDKGWDGTNNTGGLTNDVLGIKANKGGKTIQEYLTSINDRNTLYDSFRVEFFVGGHTYYTTWLRHQDNGAEGMGIMEFAIVRNNVYKVSINKVGKIGSFTSGTPGAPDPTKPELGQEDVTNGGTNPEIPGDVADSGEPTLPVVPVDPSNPDETTNVFLTVGIEVLPWTVRSNNVDL